jgi:exopolysaccharide production protein ExoQ
MKSTHESDTLEIIYVSIVTLLLTGAFFPMMLGSSSSLESNVFLNLLNVATYLLAASLVLFNSHFDFKLILKNWALYLLILMCVVSVSWSVYPFESLKKTINLLGVFVIAVYCSKRFHFVDILCLLSEILFFISIVSLIFALFIPKYGLMGLIEENGKHLGSWKGVFVHKNQLGKIMFIQVLISSYLFRYQGNVKFAFFVLVAFIGILGSSSTTALVLSLISILLILSFKYSGKLRNWVKITMLTVLVISGYILTNIESLVAIFGKDLTLTGRTFLWAELLSYVQQKPFFGYGYKGFWAGSGQMFSLTWKEAPNAHNTFIDIALDLGIMGLVLYIFYLISNFRLFFARQDQWTVFGVSLFLILFIYDFSESNALRYNNFSWFIMSLTSLSIHRTISQNVRNTKNKQSIG